MTDSRQLKPPAASRLDKFGLSVADWWAQLSAQDGKCAICKRRFTLSRLPHCDHNHRSGWFRGLLCNGCNQDLGMRHDDKDWYYSAWLYLEAPPANGVFFVPRIHEDAPPHS